MENEKLSLNNYLQLCLAFQDDPSAKNETDLKIFLSKLIILDYLPMKEKMICAARVLLEVDKDFDAVGFSAMYEINKVMYGLLKYATNLVNDIDDLNKTYSVYDLCMQFGLYDAIITQCKKDYDRFVRQLDSMISAENIYKLIETASIFNEKDYNKFIITLQEVKDLLTPETLKTLEKINLSANGMNKQLTDMLAENILRASEIAAEEDNKKAENIVNNFSKNKVENHE